MELHFDLKQIATITMILFAVIDVIGSLPVLLDLQSKMGKIQSEKATLVSGVIMIVFMFIGEQHICTQVLIFSVHNIDGISSPIAFNIFDVIILHQGFNLIETDRITIDKVHDLLIGFLGEAGS